MSLLLARSRLGVLLRSSFGSFAMRHPGARAVVSRPQATELSYPSFKNAGVWLQGRSRLGTCG